MQDTILRVAEPGQAGEVFDQFDYARWAMLPWDETARRDRATGFLANVIAGRRGRAAGVLAEHHAEPRLVDGEEANEEARIFYGEMRDLLRDPAMVTRVLNIWRGWEGYALPKERKVFIRRLRADTDEADQEALWDIFQTFIHELLYVRVSQVYDEYSMAVPEDSGHNTLDEAVVSVLTEIAWRGFKDRIDHEPGFYEQVRRTVEGPRLADQPPLRELPDPAEACATLRTRRRSTCSGTWVCRPRSRDTSEATWPRWQARARANAAACSLPAAPRAGQAGLARLARSSARARPQKVPAVQLPWSRRPRLPWSRPPRPACLPPGVRPAGWRGWR